MQRANNIYLSIYVLNGMCMFFGLLGWHVQKETMTTMQSYVRIIFMNIGTKRFSPAFQKRWENKKFRAHSNRRTQSNMSHCIHVPVGRVQIKEIAIADDFVLPYFSSFVCSINLLFESMAKEMWTRKKSFTDKMEALKAAQHH